MSCRIHTATKGAGILLAFYSWRDGSVVALAVHLFEANKRIRVITHTADKLLVKTCTNIPPEFGYYEVASRYYHPPRTAKHTFPTVDSLTWDEP